MRLKLFFTNSCARMCRITCSHDGRLFLWIQKITRSHSTLSDCFFDAYHCLNLGWIPSKNGSFSRNYVQKQPYKTAGGGTKQVLPPTFKRSFCSFCSSFISLIVLGTRPFLLPPFLFFCPRLLLLPERERACGRQGPQVGVTHDVALLHPFEFVEHLCGLSVG